MPGTEGDVTSVNKKHTYMLHTLREGSTPHSPNHRSQLPQSRYILYKGSDPRAKVRGTLAWL